MLKFVLVLAALLAIPPVWGERLSAKWRPARTNYIVVTATLDGEGSFQLQRASGSFSNWTVATNFNAFAGNVDFEEPMGAAPRIYRLARLTVPVAITAQPQGTTNLFNEPVRLEGAATGSWPIRFQWLKDGQPVPGATSNVLVFNGRAEHSGTYNLLVSNLWSVALSTPVSVKVINPVAPTVSGKKMRFVVETVPGTFPHRGTYDTRFDATGFYTTQSSNVYLNDTGYWQYQRLSENSARLFLVNSITYPGGVVTLSFQTLTNGLYTLAVTGWNGSQGGKFIFDIP